MIYGDVLNKVGVQIEYLRTLPQNFIEGMCNFIIQGKIYPGYNNNCTLWNCIEEMRGSLLYSTVNKLPELGDLPLAEIDFSDGTPVGTVCVHMTGMSDRGFVCWLGFSGDEERFIYALDSDDMDSFQEIRLPRGTMEELARSLPTVEELRAQSNYRFYDQQDYQNPQDFDWF